MASSSSNVVGVHYRVGKKIGEGSFGVIFEGTNLLNNQQVAIKFVRRRLDSIRYLVVHGRHGRSTMLRHRANILSRRRSRVKATHLNCEMSTGRTRFSLDAVCSFDNLSPDGITDFDLKLAFPTSTTSDRRVCTTSS